MSRARQEESGYTITEILVSMAVALLIMAAVYALMLQNQRVYEVESRSADMQQALRVAMQMLSQELRTAGRDPTGFAFDESQQTDVSLCPGATPVAVSADYEVAVVTAEASQIRIRRDLEFDEDGDGSIDRSLGTGTRPKDGEDESGDGCIDDPGEDVVFEYVAARQVLLRHRRQGSGPISTQPIADGLSLVSFAYLKDDGSSLAVPVTGDNRKLIRTVQVILQATADTKDPNTGEYRVYRLVNEIELRNVDLETGRMAP